MGVRGGLAKRQYLRASVFTPKPSKSCNVERCDVSLDGLAKRKLCSNFAAVWAKLQACRAVASGDHDAFDARRRPQHGQSVGCIGTQPHSNLQQSSLCQAGRHAQPRRVNAQPVGCVLARTIG